MHYITPLLASTPLSRSFGRPVWLKLENTQPAGSFKSRGMGRACEVAVQRGARTLITSSGGNAGLAVAWAGRQLAVPVVVVVPSRTSPRMRGLIEAEGAEVIVSGEVWDDAHAHALQLVETRQGALIHPFDAPEVWEGHATLIHEVAEGPVRPRAVVASVGGGGLLCGLLQGLHDVGWMDVPVLAVETEGAASYKAALEAGHPVTLPAIESLALTLGAKRVCEESVRWASRHPVVSWTCSDRAAVQAVDRFLEDHRMLVEPACGAALAAIYERAAPLTELTGDVLVVVCGGAATTRAQLDGWLSSTSTGS
jgi:L-serine/L-threonine ammonia-lyase